VFNEINVERIEDSIGGLVPEAVHLGEGRIADHFAWDGSLKYFWIVSGDESVGTAANFA